MLINNFNQVQDKVSKSPWMECLSTQWVVTAYVWAFYKITKFDKMISVGRERAVVEPAQEGPDVQDPEAEGSPDPTGNCQ